MSTITSNLTPLMIACQEINIPEVLEILARPDGKFRINDVYKTHDGNITPALLACQTENIELIQLIIYHPHASLIIDGEYIIYRDISSVAMDELLHNFINLAIRINLPNKWCFTLLHQAGMANDVKMTKVLLAHPFINPYLSKKSRRMMRPDALEVIDNFRPFSRAQSLVRVNEEIDRLCQKYRIASERIINSPNTLCVINSITALHKKFVSIPMQIVTDTEGHGSSRVCGLDNDELRNMFIEKIASVNNVVHTMCKYDDRVDVSN